MVIRPAPQRGVYTDGSWLLTRNLVPGASVYGEALVREGAVEYRRWDANRSKLAAYLKKGGRLWPFEPSSRILYLGAGSGTTVSHLSDLCPQGVIVAVEISPRVFRDLVAVAESRSNILPVLGDAARPQTYRHHLSGVDVLYQDVAQRNQTDLFRLNAEYLRPGGAGFLMLKSRSVDVAANPSDVYAAARDALSRDVLDVVDLRPLDPFETDHAALAVRKR